MPLEQKQKSQNECLHKRHVNKIFFVFLLHNITRNNTSFSTPVEQQNLKFYPLQRDCNAFVVVTCLSMSIVTTLLEIQMKQSAVEKLLK